MLINQKEGLVLGSEERKREIRHPLMMTRRRKRRVALDSDLVAKLKPTSMLQM